ncbi:MAG: ABC transporter substrate-binding protein [Gammaproteobacteria bacterium]
MANAEPVRIGLIQDWAIGTQTTRDFYDALALGFDEALRTGVIDRPVRTVLREQPAYPLGPDEAVVDAWEDLVRNEGVIGVIGPQVTQANVLLRDRVNASGIPMLAYCGTEEFHGPACFLMPNGYFPDEVRLPLAYMLRRGHRSVGVIWDDNHQGHEYMRYLRPAARRMGMEIRIDEMSFHDLPPEGVRPHLERIRAAGPDALLYLGNANLMKGIVPALRAMHWAPPRYMAVAFIIANFFGAQGLDLCEGWTGIDQYHEGNPELQRLLALFERRHGRRPMHMYTAMGWDMARTIAEAIHFAPSPDADGLRRGLENVRRLPAAIGAPGTTIGFARWDHRGFKGEYLVMRTVRDGINVLAD